MSENKYLRTIVKALDDKKGNDIRVIRISEISSMCDYLVIADGSNRNQVQAMCNNVEHAMREAGAEMKNREGYANGGWRKELTGIWISKFEAGYVLSLIHI